MKAEITVLAVLAFVLVSQASALAQSGLPTLVVDRIDPQPAEPGDDIVVAITLFNDLSSRTGEFSVGIDAQAPFILKSSEKVLESQRLCGGCRIKNTYFLSIESTAVSGTYPIYVVLTSGEAETTEQVDVKIQGKPNLIFSADPDGLNAITPGSQFPVELGVVNIGSGQAKQIKIQPDSPDFIVIGSSVKTLGTLAAGETKKVAFDFVAATDLEANSYAVPLKFSYLDEQGNAVNTTLNLGLKVVNKGSINIQAIKIASASGSPVIAAGQPFTVVVRLENVGEGDADSVEAELSCPFNGPKKAFLGQLQKDEDAPAVFDLTSPEDGKFNCTLGVSYKDDTGAHRFTEEFEASIAPADLSGILIPAVAIIVLLLAFRRRVLPFLGMKPRKR
ncbi:MAG: hypothetical protein HY367_01410 [Candidatus Aenigmarchaeota archaeon]|nr:hypothetical protein [Candidatus Aenigmarchaeota archaeon]